jgi:hypothetical protein
LLLSSSANKYDRMVAVIERASSEAINR